MRDIGWRCSDVLATASTEAFSFSCDSDACRQPPAAPLMRLISFAYAAQARGRRQESAMNGGEGMVERLY